MPETIFSKILRGEIPCHKVYEDDHVLAFLDVFPTTRGHTLVIPKEEAATMAELSDASAAALGRALPRICRAVKRVTGVEHYNILQNNGERAHQAVFHVHVHIIPKPDAEQGLGVGWPSAPIDHEDAAALAAELRAALGAA
ncbi:MAG: HIT family protein [Candidatus Krumholzibacteriia bacterium]